MRDIHISVVSHQQFVMVMNLLFDLEKQDCVDRLQVTVTINVPEQISSSLENLSFPVDITAVPLRDKKTGLIQH